RPMTEERKYLHNPTGGFAKGTKAGPGRPRKPRPKTIWEPPSDEVMQAWYEFENKCLAAAARRRRLQREELKRLNELGDKGVQDASPVTVSEDEAEAVTPLLPMAEA
ncbi:MAG: hypothetical protein ACRCXB_15255, partial [Aeromonadaceae bacterium]